MSAEIKILLMDDDEVLRKLTGKKLDRLGFAVETAREGDEALAMYRAAIDTGRPYDVVILDLVVHEGLDGKETMARLLKLDPGVRAIISSGVVGDPIMSTFWESGFIEILPKPYKTNQLENVIKRVLQQEPGD